MNTALFGLAGKISATGFVVIVILVLLSVWSLGVSMERLFVLARARRQSIAFARAVSPHLAEGGRAQTAIEAARRYPHSHVARVVAAGLATFQQQAPMRGARARSQTIIRIKTPRVSR